MSNIGTELKINVHVEPIDGLHMADYDFACLFYVHSGKFVEVRKNEMQRVDDDNYVALVDTSKTGPGEIVMRITARIPDSDFPDLLRTEVASCSTGITIRR